MKRALPPLAIGCVLVGVVAIVLAIIGWSWGWFVLASGALGAGENALEPDPDAAILAALAYL